MNFSSNSLNCFEENQWKFLQTKKPPSPSPSPDPKPKKKKKYETLIIILLVVLFIVAVTVVLIVIHKKYNWPNFAKINAWFHKRVS